MLYGIVERKIPYKRISVDLFGFIDIIAIDKKTHRILGVQSFTTKWVEHYNIITREKAENAREWLLCGGGIVLIGWRKVKRSRGSKQMVWRPRIQEITLKDLEC